MLVATLFAAPTLLILLALVVLLFTHPYAGRIGWRYMRSKKRRTVSVITFVAVGGVALGVAALLSVMSITSGFQDEFRDKVLGVNAHVLVLKYGLDFEEYRDVIERAREMPEVAGAAPFLINEMMLTKGDRISGILVKGVDPDLMPTVLDLPSQIIQGSLRGMRRPNAAPPMRPEDLLEDPGDREWDWLNQLAQDEPPSGDRAPDDPTDDPPDDPPDDDGGEGDQGFDEDALDAVLDDALDDDDGSDDGSDDRSDDDGPIVLPTVEVPSPEAAEEAMAAGETGLPSDALLDQYFEEENLLLDGPEEGVIPLADLPGIVVGTTLAQTLGLGVGDRVSVISPLAGLDTSMFTDAPTTPRSREFRVIGIFEAGFQEYDSRLVYVDLYEAQRFFEHGDSVTGVEITLHDIDAAPTVARRLERVLGGGPYHTMDWQELNHNLFTALSLQKFVLSFVIATIIFVAAFNVVATLIMIVLEKKREIAILKAMGAKSFDVLLVFMVQGLLIGLVGTAVGLLLGGGVCWYLTVFEFPLDPHVYLIDHLPVKTSPSEIVTTISIALLICITATTIPSWWAARLLPADGVRQE
ncbi:MAG: ABC transporter permease [Sandaracinaceae bacterium]